MLQVAYIHVAERQKYQVIEVTENDIYETQVFQMYSNIAQFVQHQGHQGIEKTAKQLGSWSNHSHKQSDADIACQIKRLKWKCTHAVTETLRRRYKKHIVRLIQHAGEHTECTWYTTLFFFTLSGIYAVGPSSNFCNFTPRLHQKQSQKVRNPKFSWGEDAPSTGCSGSQRVSLYWGNWYLKSQILILPHYSQYWGQWGTRCTTTIGAFNMDYRYTMIHNSYSLRGY